MASSHWKPDKNAVQKEYDLIVKSYENTGGKVPENYSIWIWEFAKIAAFLQDEKAVLVQLEKLNILLKVAAKKRGTYQKVLRDMLEDRLEKIGFQKDLAKATGFLRPEVFRFAVSEGLLIKDPGAGKDHGEFSHAIQWLIIGWQQNETQFLDKPVIEIFKQLGDGQSMLSQTKGIWDFIVDKIGSKDYRSPEYLYKTILTSNNPKLSSLKDIFESRAEKLEEKKLEANSNLFSGVNAQEDIQRKYPKKEYETSNASEKLLITRK